MDCHCDKFPVELPNYKHLLKTSQPGFYKNLKPHLKTIEEHPSPRLSFYQCQNCSRIWVKDWPTPEEYGGGEPCYYILDVADPHSWLANRVNRKKVGIASQAYRQFSQERQEYLEKRFLNGLGLEVGPEKCRKVDCDHLTVKNSIMCKQHHLEMIKRLNNGQLFSP